MLTIDKNTAQKFEIGLIREEYNSVSNDLYTSFYTSTDLIEAYAELLKTALVKNIFHSKEQRANIIRFLAKLQTQKELIELAADSKKLEETKKAAVS